MRKVCRSRDPNLPAVLKHSRMLSWLAELLFEAGKGATQRRVERFQSWGRNLSMVPLTLALEGRWMFFHQ